MLTEQEWADVEAYDRMTAAQLAEQNRPEPKPYTLADHLDALIRFHHEEIAFQGAEIGALQIVKTQFRKNKHINQLCDFHIRICNAVMEDALHAIDRIKSEKKSCRV